MNNQLFAEITDTKIILHTRSNDQKLVITLESQNIINNILYNLTYLKERIQKSTLKKKNVSIILVIQALKNVSEQRAHLMILQNALLFTKSGFQIVAIFDQMPNSYQNNLKNYYASFTRTSSIQRVCILALCTITLVSILLYIHIHLTHRITTAKKTLETISLQQNASTPNLKEQYDVLIAHHADVANCSKLNTLLYQGILTIIDALPKNTSLHALTSTSQIKNQNTSNKKFTIAILGTSINEKEINTLIQNLEISEKFKNLTFIQLKQEASTHPFYSFELSCFL